MGGHETGKSGAKLGACAPGPGLKPPLRRLLSSCFSLHRARISHKRLPVNVKCWHGLINWFERIRRHSSAEFICGRRQLP